jgi:hypothetical protein
MLPEADQVRLRHMLDVVRERMPLLAKVMGDRETEFLTDCHQAEPQAKKLGFSK